MTRLPRIAVGNIEASAAPQPMVWALLDVLSRQNRQVQHFLSQACFTPWQAPRAVTGLCSRHLDTWLMSPELCRELFHHSASSADFSLVEGTFVDPLRTETNIGSRLEELCDWLDLPRLAIVDASRLESCKIPARPEKLDGVLLDGLCGGGELSRAATLFETLWGVPVLGTLPPNDHLAQEFQAPPADEQPLRDLCRRLGDALLADLRIDRLWQLAERSELALPEMSRWMLGSDDQPMRVAVAYDAAFHCYFADTLDLLELRGASVLDFSPLRDESLPADTDIVYFGCGHPDRFAAELASNHCMLSALRNHVCAGRRLYAEGGGLAYLCRDLEMPDGQRLPMAGVFPATARVQTEPWTPYPCEAVLASGNWLGKSGTRLRGYVNSGWSLQSTDGLTHCLRDPGQRGNLVARHHALGSLLHLNFAVQPEVFGSFLKSHAASLEWPQCRSAT